MRHSGRYRRFDVDMANRTGDRLVMTGGPRQCRLINDVPWDELSDMELGQSCGHSPAMEIILFILKTKIVL